MNKQYTYIENQYPARPRSKRRREMGGGNTGGGTTVVAGGGTGSEGTGSVTSHSQLSGIVSTDDEYSEFANDIHLTATDADALKRLSNLEIIESTQIGSIIPTDKNLYSALATDFRIAKELDDFLEDINEMFLRKDINDTAHGIISFDKKIGSSIFLDGYNGKGWEINETGAALFDSARIRSDLYVGNKIGSPTFASGFAGWGVDVDIPTATAEMDNLFIRKTFTAYEIVYSQIYGLGGSQIVSDLNKIARVEILTDRYRCYMDDMDGLMLMNLRKGDGVRIQTRTGTTSIKYLFGRCIGVDSEYFDIAIPLLSGSGQPEAGDFAMRWGNNEDTDRQGLIYLTTADSGAPFIDVYDGITDESTEGKLKVRLGNLKGIRTQSGDQLRGYGGYLNGLYIENSTFYTENGETIEQQFSIMEGLIKSEMASVRYDMNVKDNYLNNTVFAGNLDGWSPGKGIRIFKLGDKLLRLNNNFYADKYSTANIVTYNNRYVLRIKNSDITQRNADLARHPKFELVDQIVVNEDGSEGVIGQLYRPKMFYISFKYLVKTAGTLQVHFKGENGTDFEEYTKIDYTKELEPTTEFMTMEISGKWSGTGDFYLSFTGDIYIYHLFLASNPMSDFIETYKSNIEITEKKLDVMYTHIKKNDVDIEKYYSEIQLTAEELRLSLTKEVNDVKTAVSQLELRADQLSTAIGSNSTAIDAAKDLANKALGSGVYSQEQYSQTTNPWQSWSSGTEYKHVGALWYNPSTGITKRYVGTDSSDRWENVSNSTISAASYVLQNKDKWSLVVANFDSKGKPTNASGIVTTAYGNTLWASKDGIISAINQSPESISIDASKINLNGVVTANRTFTIELDGTFRASAGTIGRFEIISNRLVWNQANYFGGSPRALKLGYSTGNEGVVDVMFDASTEGKFGVKAVGRAPGSAAIYGSSQSSPSYPTDSSVWAGWFDGYINTKGYFINGKGGVNWNQTTGSPDLDKIRLIVEGGIIIGYYKE